MVKGSENPMNSRITIRIIALAGSLIIAAISATAICQVSASPAKLRIATYNIQNLKTESARDGDRIAKLRKIVSDIGADVFALQEIADRKAVELVFSPTDWQIIIDDESKDEQDLAVAMRKTWKPLGFEADLDADDRHFLAPGQSSESFFPNRRDALHVPISTPDGRRTLHVICVHLKSRRDGRSKTESRREGAGRILATVISTRLSGQQVVVMGDFNDTPDDRCLNILETGQLEAPAGPEETDGALFVNLCEPLIARDWATEGCKPEYIEKQTGWIDVRVPGSRKRNNDQRGSDRHSGPALFDQILISSSLKAA
jgi:endonuclease/exonuclease/phosphatase family metal-dependent hydrolase